MYHTRLWFGHISIGDLTIGQLSFIQEGLDRMFKEENKRIKKANRGRR